MHLRHLTHIRGFAAVWVLAFHYEHHFLAIWPETGDGPFDVIVRHGYLGVDLFFVLSGFVISMSYAAILASNERRPLLTFIRNRVTRIYPLLMLTTLIAIAIWGLGRQLGRTEWGGPQIEATGILPNIVGIQQWVAVPSINSPSWSVSAELMRLLARAHAKDQSAQPHRSLELRAISDSSSIAMFAHSSKNRCGAGWICRSPNDNRGAAGLRPSCAQPCCTTISSCPFKRDYDEPLVHLSYQLNQSPNPTRTTSQKATEGNTSMFSPPGVKG